MPVVEAAETVEVHPSPATHDILTQLKAGEIGLETVRKIFPVA